MSMPRLATLALALAVSLPALAEIPDSRQEELRHMLLHDCGSCHGMTMKGGLGPSLTPEELEAKPDAMLRATILVGRAGTPMPPWQAILSEEEVEYMVRLLREGVADAR